MAENKDNKLPNLYFFEERLFHALDHSLKVFICGVDVSQHLKGNLSVTYGDRESYNSCSFELANPRRLWQITPDNAINAEFSAAEQAKANVFEYKNDPVRNPFYNLEVQVALFGKVDKTRQAVNGPGSGGQTPAYHQDDLEERKWRLAINDCIFNKMDHIRIFSKNPYTKSNDQWMEVFCGFVHDVAVTTNYMNGESTVRLTGTCIKQLLKKMRATKAPFAESINLDPAPTFTAGFFADFISPGVGTHPMGVSSLENTISILITGTTSNADFKTDNDPTTHKGIGFKKGNIICYDPKEPGNVLERWHLMALFGVNKVPFPVGGGQDNMWLTLKEVNRIGAHTRAEKDNVVGGPDARYLHMLLPASGSGPATLVESDVVSGAVPTTKEFTDRWEIIRDFASKLDYQVLTSPSGDLLLEFPQYGFTPEIYSSVKMDPVKKVKDIPKGEGALGRVFVFDSHVKEDTLVDEGEDFPTLLSASGGLAQGVLNQAVNESAVIEGVNLRAYVHAPQLVARYGLITESADFPFLGTSASDYGGNVQRRLAQLALLEYTKRIAAASSWTGSLVYRPLILPNRPIHFPKIGRMATMKTVTHTWTVNQSATTSVNCHMLMAQRYDGSYRMLTGSPNVPMDVSQFWEMKEEGPHQHGNSGVRVVIQETKKEAKPEGTPGGVTPSSKDGGVAKKSSVSLGTLYPPFANMMSEVIAAAAVEGIDLKVSSAWRSGSTQTSIPASNTNAEAFLSYHQYGLACDITAYVNGKPRYDWGDPVYAKVNAINQRLFGKEQMKWGGDFKVGSGANLRADTIHFQIPVAWSVNIDDAVAIRQRHVGEPEQRALKAVWDFITARNPRLAAEAGDTLPPISPDLVAISAQGRALARAEKRNVLLNKSVQKQKAKSLEEQLLQSKESVQDAAKGAVGDISASVLNVISPVPTCETIKRQLKEPGLKPEPAATKPGSGIGVLAR